jgi:uncharacterized membrane protein
MRRGGGAMRRIVLVMSAAALLAALVAAIRRALSRESALTRPLRASDSVVIERPPQEVFAYVSDLKNLPEWGALSGEMRKETEGPPEVGARYTADLTFLGRRLVISYEVSAYEPPRLFAFRNLDGPLYDKYTYTFEEEPGGGETRFSMAIEMQPGGFYRLIGPLLEQMTQRYYFRKELKTLKGLLESRG